MDKKQEKSMTKFGLIGKNIEYSFSIRYFENKFLKENITNCTYLNFDIPSIAVFNTNVKTTPNLKGLNVTIPYKESIIPLLDKLSKKAKAIGAVNTIRITKKGKFIGHNTDCYGFKKSLQPHLQATHKKALILGTGGASKAIAFSLQELGIEYAFVSRNLNISATYSYDSLTPSIIKKHALIINCTPLGTHPNVNVAPNIPYEAITEKHLLFDLIYNPEETVFLSQGKKRGAKTVNGLKMLELQAEKAWKIWNR